MQKRRDNRGSAMIIVIVVIAFVSILIAVLLTMSTINIQMKNVNRNAKENFYSAEGALEQITLGLQQELSVASVTAYGEVMQQYANRTLEVERRQLFNQSFLNLLKARLENGEITDKYSLLLLGSYLSTEVAPCTELTSTQGALLIRETDSLVLKGLVVTYTDADGYQSIIETDIRLTAPHLNLTQPSDLPDLFEYSIIANEQLVAEANSHVTVEAGVYVGEDGLILESGTEWEFREANRVVVNGEISVPRTAYLATSTDMDLWTKELKVTGGELVARGRTYVADDLIMSDNGSSVFLEGEYYGFGNGEVLSDAGVMLPEGGDSSAILINGVNSTLDMENLRRLLLSGSAQIATSNVPFEGVGYENVNINLGESIEVKSNQIAYLVPPECIGVNGGETIIGNNPINAAQYTELMSYAHNNSEYPDFEIVSFTREVEGLGRSLGEYRTPGTDGYRMIFVQTPDGTMVYFYVDFDSDNSSQYFRDYYERNQDVLERNMNHYVNQIRMSNRFTRRTTDGNMIYSANDNSGRIHLLSNEDGHGAYMTLTESNNLHNEEEGYQKNYKALSSKLVMNYDDLTQEEKVRDLFDNLVRYSDDPGDADAYAFAGMSPGTVEEYEGNGARAVVVHNRGGEAYRYAGDPGQEICMILATGDVVLEQDFSGVVIARGNVTVDNSVHTVTANRDRVYRVLKERVNPADDASETVLQHYFRDGDRYALDVDNGVAGISGDYISFSDLVTYEEWTKR